MVEGNGGTAAQKDYTGGKLPHEKRGENNIMIPQLLNAKQKNRGGDN